MLTACERMSAGTWLFWGHTCARLWVSVAPPARTGLPPYNPLGGHPRNPRLLSICRLAYPPSHKGGRVREGVPPGGVWGSCRRHARGACAPAREARPIADSSSRQHVRTVRRAQLALGDLARRRQRDVHRRKHVIRQLPFGELAWRDAQGCRPWSARRPWRLDDDEQRPLVHFGCGTAMTAALATPGQPIAMFSTSIELIHSPPDLIRSLVRSTMIRNPSGVMRATSPVPNQPSLSRAARRPSRSCSSPRSRSAAAHEQLAGRLAVVRHALAVLADQLQLDAEHALALVRSSAPRARRSGAAASSARSA